MFSLIQRKDCSSPLPLQLPLAFIFRRVEETARADLVIDYRDGLETVGEDYVGVHGCYIDVVD